MTENQELSTHLVRSVVKPNIPRRNATLEQTTGGTETGTTMKHSESKCNCSSCSPTFTLKQPRLHSGTAGDRPETITMTKLSPNLEVDLQQPPETSINQHYLITIRNDCTKQTTQETHRLIDTQMSDVARQTSPPTENHPQNPVVFTEKPPVNQTGNEPVPFFSCSNTCPTDIQESEKHILTTLIGDTTISPLTITTPLTK